LFENMSGMSSDEGPQPPRLAFTLILRLEDDARPPSGWTDWKEAATVLGKAATDDAQTEAPYKRYPLDGHAYFADHVERALFPPSDAQCGGRWLHRPDRRELRLGAADCATYTLSIELLEIVRFDLRPYPSYGLLHLSFVGEPSAQEMIRCAALLHRRYRKSSDIDYPRFEVAQADQGSAQPLRGTAPLKALAQEVFGSAHRNLYRQAWICAIAQRPPEIAGDDVAAWRRALGRGYTLEDARDAIEDDPERNQRQTTILGPFAAVILGRSAAFTNDDRPAAQLYNFRSYWAESLLLAIVQHDYLEGFAVKLGELGQDPLGRPVDALYVNWLAFLNVLGWSYLSTTTDVPQRLLTAAGYGLRTPSLRDELDKAFATYVAQRQRRSDDAQEGALAALQVYGAVFAAVGTVAAALQVIGDHLFDDWPARIGALLGLAILGAVVYLMMRRRVNSPEEHP
jgi:hypothetical protein